MAKSVGNVVTYGLSGLIGKLLVFRQRAGKTFVGDRPVKTSKAPTAELKAVREKFAKAIIYAKMVNDVNDEVKAGYQAKTEPGQSAFNLAFADYMKAPVFVEAPAFPGYSGQQNTSLPVLVKDDFRVTSVFFEVLDADNNVLESGEAAGTGDSPLWVYQTSTEQEDLAGGKVKIVAKDLPGNETIAEVTLV